MEKNCKEIGGKLERNWRKVMKLWKKVKEGLKKFLRNFTLNLEKVGRKSVEFKN